MTELAIFEIADEPQILSDNFQIKSQGHAHIHSVVSADCVPVLRVVDLDGGQLRRQSCPRCLEAPQRVVRPWPTISSPRSLKDLTISGQ